MKKLFVLMAVALLAVTASAQQIIQFTLKVNNPAELTNVQIFTFGGAQDGTIDVTLTSNETQLAADVSGFEHYLYFVPMPPAKVLAYYLRDKDGNLLDSMEGEMASLQVVELPAALDGGVFEIVTGQPQANKSVTVNLKGDPSKVAFFLGVTQVELTEGTQTVKYSAAQTPVYILPVDVTMLYRVTCNGREVEPWQDFERRYQYTIYQKDGDVIDIETDFPDVSYDVNFALGDGARDALVGVYVDGRAVDDPQQVKAPAGSTLQVIIDTDNWDITNFTADGVTYNIPDGTWSTVVLHPFDMSLEVKPIVRPLTAETYTYNWDLLGRPGSDYLGYEFIRADHKAVKIANGYGQLNFRSQESPFYFNVWTDNDAEYYLFVNETLYSGSGDGYVTLNDGDVFKVFLTVQEPEAYPVRYTLDGVEGDLSIIRDHIVAVDPAKGHNSLPGTLVTVSAADGVIKYMTVNGVEVEPEEGLRSFVVEGPTEVAIGGQGSGVTSVEAENGASEFVYDLQGRRLTPGAELAPGIYIVNGRKIAIKSRR